MYDLVNNCYVFIVACLFYVPVRYNRGMDRGHLRVIKISPVIEKILFPFSDDGCASLFSIIMAGYLELSVPAAYIAIFFLKVPAHGVNDTWLLSFFVIAGLATCLLIVHEFLLNNNNEVRVITKIGMGLFLLICICGEIYLIIMLIIWMVLGLYMGL